MRKRRVFSQLKWVICCVFAVALLGCDKEQEIFSLNSPQLYVTDGSGVGGNQQGSITVVEFFDYRCHACKLSFPAVHTLTSIDPDVRVVYRDLPILGYVSEIAAKASLAARYQNKYIRFHNALMRASSLRSADDVYAIAQKMGLDVSQLKTDMNRSEIRKQLDENYAVAKSLDIVGTPAFLFAKTTWGKKGLSASGATLVRGAMNMTDFKKLIVSIRLNN